MVADLGHPGVGDPVGMFIRNSMQASETREWGQYQG
jgi:hypothetical protein